MAKPLMSQTRPDGGDDRMIWSLDHNRIEGMSGLSKTFNGADDWMVPHGTEAMNIDQEINAVGIPIDSYFAVEEIKDDGIETRKPFLHLPSTIEAEEAEEIGVEHLFWDVKDSTTTALKF